MLSFILKNKLISIIFLAFLASLFFTNFSFAQNNGCQIDPVGTKLRPSDYFIEDYNDNPMPTVYLDVKTINCNTATTSNLLKFVFYTAGVLTNPPNEIQIHESGYFYMAPPSISSNPGFNAIFVSSSDFSVPIKLGEGGQSDYCINNDDFYLWGNGGLFGGSPQQFFESSLVNSYVLSSDSDGDPIPDCMIYVKVFLKNPATPNIPDVLIHEIGNLQNPKLLYECDAGCTTNFIIAGDFCFPPSQQNTSNILPYGQTCPLDNSTISVTTTSNQTGTTGSVDFSDAPLAPLPGFDTNPDLGGFLKSLFTFLIVIAGLLAFIMIVRGGITYLTSDSFGQKGNGKEYIQNAIFGLVLALGAWVILNTINPDLASDLNIAIPQVSLDGYEYTSPGVASIPSSCGPQNPPSCTNCQQIQGGIDLKPEVAQPGHNTIGQSTLQKLYNMQNILNQNNISWRVTEAFMPTYMQHCSQCHYKGTCIDANFNGTNPTPQNIEAFVNAAAQSGLRAVYETNSSATITQIQEQTDLQPSTRGGQGNYLLLNGITAPHFSVYNQ